MNETEWLVDCVRRIESSGVAYMLVGSMAGNYWGVPRSTHDIDFVIQYDADDVDRLVTSFEDSFFIQTISVQAGLKPPGQFNVLDNRSALKVDFFRLTGDDYKFERFARRMRTDLFGQQSWIATAEDVLLHKLRWHLLNPTDRQLSDARGIVAVSGKSLDQAYLAKWARQIGVTDLLRPILETE